jgi:hypothetical protein
MGVARLLPILALALTAAALAAESTAFKRTVAGAEIDWSAGVVTAQAGSAADIRMPGPDSARPGAERRARAAAESKLQSALREVGLDKLTKDKTALDRAEISTVEYQSNGGVVLWLSVRFLDLLPANAAPRALKVATMPFEIAPTLVAGGKEARVASATYRPSSLCPKDAIPVRRDDKGRLVLPASEPIDSLAGSAVVIYLEKAQL